MDSSILNIDEILQDDSFILLADDEVTNTATNILKQWGMAAEEQAAAGLNTTVTMSTDNNPYPANSHHPRFGLNPKLVDTRTFTRPKKQPRQFLNDTMVMGGGSPTEFQTQLSQSPKGPGIHLQIGGLVTNKAANGGNAGLPFTMTQSSMQKSLIGDTSPPSSICSSTIDLAMERLSQGGGPNGGGLITSSDFGNELNFLQQPSNGGSAAPPEPSYNGYNMGDVMKDMDMLQNLTFEGELNGSSAEKESVGVGNAEATVLIAREVPVNQTFENGNGTFDLIGDEGGTCGQTVNMGDSGRLATGAEEETEEQNSTFNLTKLVKVNSEEKQPVATTVVEEDEVHLDFAEDNDSFIQSTPICRDKRKQNDIFNFSPTGNDELYRTIEMNMKNNAFKVPQLPARFADRAAAAVLEKEVVDEKVVVAETAPAVVLSRTVELSKTIELGPAEDDPLASSPEDEEVPEIRQKEPTSVDMLRPEERQSLVNFEEYEKSLQLLDDNRNERDFDDMLASINTSDMRKTTEKMRQSLDSIKKRHSLINYERQQEELRRKVNDIDQEINNLTMDGSGSGARLLNRRSRLYDEVQQQQQENVMNRTMDLNTTNQLNGQSGGGTNGDQPEGERRAVPEKRDRDRFKTIKIFRKTVNANIPDADETLEDVANATKVIGIDGNEEEGDDEVNDVPKVREDVAMAPPPTRGLARPSRILTRPKYTSGLMRPSQLGIAALKASSADDLLDSRKGEVLDEGSREMSQERGSSVGGPRANPSKMAPQGAKLKSPMGIKSKSIHNLMVNGGSSGIGGGGVGQSRYGAGGMSRMSAQTEMRPFSTNTFKVSRPSYNPAPSTSVNSGTFQRPAKPSGGVNMRQPKSISGVQRPVSAVLGQSPSSMALMDNHQSVERPGKYSPMDHPEPVQGKFEPRSAASIGATRTSGLRAPAPSGIARPTTGGARSGLPRLSGIPRR